MSSGNSDDASPSPSPSANSSNQPKNGKIVPNRVFVAGISQHITESDLSELFSKYGNVKWVNIILDRGGISKGYGFVTFETEEEASRVPKEECVHFKNCSMKIANAYRRTHSFSSGFGSSCDSASERSSTPVQPRSSGDWPGFTSTYNTDQAQVLPSTQYYYHNGAAYTCPNGVTYPSSDTSCHYAQPQPVYSLMYTQPLYIPQYQYQSAAAATQPHWAGQPFRWAAPLGYGQAPGGSAGSSIPSSDGVPYVIALPSFLAASAPLASANPTSASNPQYVCSNGAPTSPANGLRHQGASVQNVGDSSCPISNPSSAPAAYSYPIPAILAPYHLQGGAGDGVEVPVLDAVSSEQLTLVQESMGPTKHDMLGKMGPAGGLQVAQPIAYHGNKPDDSRPHTYDQNSGYRNRGYRKNYQSGSPRKPTYNYHNNSNHYSPQRRFKSKPLAPAFHAYSYGNGYEATAGKYNNPSAAPPSLTKINHPPPSISSAVPLTPPATPIATVSENNDASVGSTAKQLQALSL